MKLQDLYDILSPLLPKLKWLEENAEQIFMRPAYDRDPATLPMNQDSTPVTPTTPKPTLEQLLTAVRDFEGKPGDANYRNCNPGNFRCSPIGYLPIYEPVECTPDDFARFKDYNTGWLYFKNDTISKIHIHPNWTLQDWISNRAPSSDKNNPIHYAQTVAKELNISVDYPMKNFLDTA